MQNATFPVRIIVMKKCFTIIWEIIAFVDLKECTMMREPCSGHGVCFELPGSYRCDCEEGWEGPFCANGMICKYFGA